MKALARGQKMMEEDRNTTPQALHQTLLAEIHGLREQVRNLAQQVQKLARRTT